MIIVAVDPSGNHGNEGMGITGLARFENGDVESLMEVKAERFDSEEGYWHGVLGQIFDLDPDHVVIEGFKLYNHKKSEQVNSELQTPQLIGFLKAILWAQGVPFNVQFASEVKQRWSDDQLVKRGILNEQGGRLYWGTIPTNTHKRDAIRHGMHCWKYIHAKK